MGCATIRTEGGGFAIACSRGRGGVQPCVVCGRVATLQCDHPTRPKPSRALCNAHMCHEHAVNVGPDRDWCHPCATADAVLAGGTRPPAVTRWGQP